MGLSPKRKIRGLTPKFHRDLASHGHLPILQEGPGLVWPVVCSVLAESEEKGSSKASKAMREKPKPRHLQHHARPVPLAPVAEG
jgi:hypothetical protein